METVVHDGRETAYRLAQPNGDGPTMLYVHGSGGTHRVWAGQYGPDGPGHPAVALDLSGHGESDDVETEPGAETLAAYVDDVRAVASETEPDVLVGNSLGGAVVLAALVDSPLDPAGAVLAGTGSRLPVHEHLRELLADDFDRAIEFLHENGRLLFDPDDRTRERSIAQMRAAGQRVTRRDFLTCHTFDVSDRLAEISVPALALVGEHDSLTPPSYHESLSSGISRCELATLAESAHLTMVETPDAFNAAVESFCDRWLNAER